MASHREPEPAIRTRKWFLLAVFRPVGDCNPTLSVRVKSPVFFAVWRCKTVRVAQLSYPPNPQIVTPPPPSWELVELVRIAYKLARWAETGRFERSLSMTGRSLTAIMGQNGASMAVLRRDRARRTGHWPWDSTRLAWVSFAIAEFSPTPGTARPLAMRLPPMVLPENFEKEIFGAL